MKTSILLPVLLVGTAFVDASADEAKKEEPKDRPVRVEFVPGSKPMKGESEFDGAAFSALNKGGPAGPDVYWMAARSGIGDKFPVREAGGPLLFEVRVAKGDDDHLELEANCKGVITKLELKRDQPVEAEVAGAKYEFLFPNIYLGAGQAVKPTTPKAKIMITRLK